ncbi:protein adenylyltransferase SelO [Lysinibacillus sp. LZ02]|uniref:protein adenylyltransferase SelO n=1 Tax=Lysinibacillus sp. LZ02 TaxID=3420668 RepID=UPI003D36BA09
MTNKEKSIGWHFDNSYLTLPTFFYSNIELNPVSAPALVVLNEAVAKELGLDSVQLQTAEAVAILAGNEMPKGAAQIAQAYAGHQFGHFTILGDGRAVLIGEQLTPEGKRFDLQLKGSGRTPYSRRGDGRAALGPMLREYIISEAMHALNIPTTRSLAVIATGEPVFREQELEGAILTRVASSHIRVGTFEYAAKYGEVEDVRKLADYTITRHYPELTHSEHPYLALFEQVMQRQAELVAKWQLVGFIHGVMNTDNVTISGETIDYGPCAFMDTYHLDTVFSSIDAQGRYAYGNQPQITGWNLARFAESLLPLMHEDIEQAADMVQKKLDNYSGYFYAIWLSGMRNKLGLMTEESEDAQLMKSLLVTMQTYEADYTNTFRALVDNNRPATPFFLSDEFLAWEQTWQERLIRQGTTFEAVQALMKRSNPAIIPRNHRVEEALTAAVKDGDYTVMDKLLEVLSNPYELSKENERFATPPHADAGPYRTFCGT